MNCHKIEVMRTIGNATEASLKKGMVVELNAVEAIEQALITRHTPEWNNFVQAASTSREDAQ